MNGHHDSVIDVDVGKPSFPVRESPTFRIHVHNFESLRYSAESPEFSCFGRRWKADVYPEGISGESRGMVSFFLTMCGEGDDDEDSFSSSDDNSDGDSSSERGVRVRFYVSVKDLDGKTLKRRGRSHDFTSCEDEKGFVHFIERRLVTGPSNNVLCDGTLTLELRLKSLTRKNNAPCRPFVPVNPLAENIRSLFMDEATADVLFAVWKEDGGEATNFHAHRLVLRACARNLAAFCGDPPTDDSDGGPLNPISIPRVDPHVFKLLLFYVYGGSISAADWRRHARDLIDAADLYGVVNLKLEAEARYVKSTKVTVRNVVELIAYANSKQCAHLKELLMDFVVQNKNDVLKRVASARDVPESSTMFTDLLAAMAREERGNEDDTSDEEGLDTLRVGELRRRLHDRGLDVDGSRETLVARLREVVSRKSGEKRKRSSQDGIVEIE